MFIFALALIVYWIKPSWLMLLWLVFTPLLAPFVALFSQMGDLDSVIGFLTSIWGMFNRAFLVIIFYELIVKKKWRLIKKVPYLSLVVLSIYLVFQNLVTHMDIPILYNNIMGMLYVIIPLVFLLIKEEARPSSLQVIVVISVVYLVQLLFLPLNANGIFAYVSRLELFANNSGEALLFPGTFLKSNGLADYVALTYLFICIDFFRRRSISTLLFALISIAAIVLLFFSGSRLPIVVTVFAFVACTFLFVKNKLKVLIIYAVLGFVLITAVFSFSETIPGAKRITDGLTSFAESKSKNSHSSDESTVRLSSKLIAAYFGSSPIVGHGFFYKGDNAYPINDTISNLTNYKADATLALYLVEFGIVGLLLYLWYFFRVTEYACSFVGPDGRKVILIVFTFFLLFSITEAGFFNVSNFNYLFIYVAPFIPSRKVYQKGAIYLPSNKGIVVIDCIVIRHARKKRNSRIEYSISRAPFSAQNDSHQEAIPGTSVEDLLKLYGDGIIVLYRNNNKVQTISRIVAGKNARRLFSWKTGRITIRTAGIRWSSINNQKMNENDVVYIV